MRNTDFLLKQRQVVVVVNDVQIFVGADRFVAVRQSVERGGVDHQRAFVVSRTVQDALFRRFQIAFDLVELNVVAKMPHAFDGGGAAGARPETAVENDVAARPRDAFAQFPSELRHFGVRGVEFVLRQVAPEQFANKFVVVQDDGVVSRRQLARDGRFAEPHKAAKKMNRRHFLFEPAFDGGNPAVDFAFHSADVGEVQHRQNDQNDPEIRSDENQRFADEFGDAPKQGGEHFVQQIVEIAFHFKVPFIKQDAAHCANFSRLLQ